MSKAKHKPISKMTTKELARATKEFDEEFSADSFAPPPPEAREKLARAKRKRGRPRKGQGVKVISVSVEKELLARADSLAKRLGISRAEMISRGLMAALLTVGQDV